MPHFFTEQSCKPKRTVELTGEDAKHILKVLRLKKGDWLVLSDSDGRSFRSTIVDAGRKNLTCMIEEEILIKAAARPPTLAIAAIRKKRFEWAVIKSVELGCEHIIPFISDRTVSFRASSLVSKSKRWQKLAVEAAKQSGLSRIPAVDEMTRFDDLLDKIPNHSPSLFLYEGERKNSIKSTLRNKAETFDKDKPPLLIIGPEGGFSSKEVERAIAAGAISVSLGNQILRVETAAVACMAILQYEIGNMAIA